MRTLIELARSPAYRHSRRDFGAVLLTFGLPYGLAVVIQDFVMPAFQSGDVLPALIFGVVLLGVAGAGLATCSRVRTEDEIMAPAPREVPDTVQRHPCASRCPLGTDVRRLVTIVRWLRRDAGERFPQEPTMRHLAALAAQVERLGSTLDVDHRAPRPRFASHTCPRAGRPHSAAPGMTSASTPERSRVALAPAHPRGIASNTNPLPLPIGVNTR